MEPEGASAPGDGAAAAAEPWPMPPPPPPAHGVPARPPAAVSAAAPPAAGPPAHSGLPPPAQPAGPVPAASVVAPWYLAPWRPTRALPPIPGASLFTAAGAVAGVLGFLLAGVAAWLLAGLSSLPDGVVADGSNAAPRMAGILGAGIAVAVAVAVGAGRFMLVRATALTGDPSVRAFLGPVPATAATGAISDATRSVGAAAVLAAAGVLPSLIGGLLLALADARGPFRAGGTLALLGGAAVAVAAGAVPSVRAAVRRRCSATLRRTDGPTWELPEARSALVLPWALVAVVAVLFVPFAAAGTTAIPAACEVDPGWTCGQVRVPVDHAAGAPRPAMTTVAYAVHESDRPQADRRVLVIAVGGPGSPGIEDGPWLLDELGTRVSDRFDVVIYDPRGTGASDPVDCPYAADAWYDSDGLSSTAARAFAEGCVAEAGFAEAGTRRFATAQVAEDIDAIRARLGVDRISLYGVSYGTVVAQVYAAAHADRLDALVLDAPVDRSVPPATMWATAANGFRRTLLQSFAACRSDDNCAQALADPETAWERLLARIDRIGALQASLPTPDGDSRMVSMTREQLEALMGYAMYDDNLRMLFLRALAQDAKGDPRGILRLWDAEQGYDRDSTLAYYATWCEDGRVSPSARTDDFVAFRDVARAAGVTDRTYTDIAATLAPCLFWPDQAPAWAPPAEATSVPTLILTATSDPITPIEGARSILARHPEARLVETRGGDHGTVADECPSEHVGRFLVEGRLPEHRTTTCIGQVIDWFWPLAPGWARTAEDAVDGVYWELFADPYVQSWSGDRTLKIACSDGGWITLTPDVGSTQATLDECAYASGAAFSGVLTVTFRDWRVEGTLRAARGTLQVDAGTAKWRISGTWDRKDVDIDE